MKHWIKITLGLAALAFCGAAAALPAVAIVAAYSSVTTGMAALAAGTLAGTLVGGAMIAGGALTALGTVTKNEKLMKIGGVLSIAGGVGNIARTALQSGAATAAGGASGAAAEGSKQAATSLGQSAAPAAQQATQQTVQQAATDVASNASNPLVQAGAEATAAVPGADALAQGAQAPSGTGAVGQLKSASQGLANFMKENKELVNAASGLLGGAMKAYGEERAADKARAQEREETEAFNASQAVSVGGRFDPSARVFTGQVQPVDRFVAGRPAAPRPAGFINQAMRRQ